MSRVLFFNLSAASALALSSCQTTGDPSQGGLFGWSEGKAQQRSAAMAAHLEDVESDTDYQRSRSRALEEKKAAKERELKETQP